MAKHQEDEKASEMRINGSDFLVLYNKNIPKTFPRMSTALMVKFKGEFPMLFKRDDLWSLDQHRKKLIDWLPRNVEAK